MQDTIDEPSASDNDVRYVGYARHTTADGVDLAYRTQGDGPETIVVISSILETSTAWRAFSRRAARRNRIVIYDLRGVGRSSAGEPTYDNHVADLHSLLVALGVERAILMGHSISTQLCVAFALAHPELARALILIGPMVHPTGAERRRRLIEGWSEVLRLGGAPAMFDVFWPQILCDGTFQRGGPGSYDAYRELWVADTPPQNVAAQLRAALAAQATPRPLPEVRCPTLLLAGEDDFVGTPTALRESEQQLPDGRVVRLPDVGHVPHLEAPLSLHQAIDRFLAAIPAAAAPTRVT